MTSLMSSAAPYTPTDGVFLAVVECLRAVDSRWRVLRVDGGMTAVVRMRNDGSNDFLCLSLETTYWFREDADGRRTLAINGALDLIVDVIRQRSADEPLTSLPFATDSVGDERL